VRSGHCRSPSLHALRSRRLSASWLQAILRFEILSLLEQNSGGILPTFLVVKADIAILEAKTFCHYASVEIPEVFLTASANFKCTLDPS
jgi:hypothetical protein